MKTLLHFRTHDEAYFHSHPFHPVFSVVASFILSVHVAPNGVVHHESSVRILVMHLTCGADGYSHGCRRPAVGGSGPPTG